jgi:RimJ/RimL family protein N-acetyltransferase
VLELEHIISFTVPENAATRRVMEKCGLVQQGETRWRGLDHVWYAIDRRDREAAGN